MSQGQVVESTPVETPSAAPAGQAPDVSAGTPESQAGQATSQDQSAPGEESFSNIDPKTLAPELQAIYKNLQADYTKKTQGAAESRKKAEAFDQLSADQRFRDYWTGLSRPQKTEFKEQKAEAEKAMGEKISDEEFAKAFNSKQDFLSLLERVVEDKRVKDHDRIRELEQKLSVSEAADVVEAFATEVGKDGKPVRPDFYELNDPKYNLINGYLNVFKPDNQSPEAYVQRMNEAYTWAKQLTQDFYTKGKNEALAIIQKKAAASTEMPTQAAKSSFSGGDPKKWSVKEAIERAKRGEKVPQVYD
jgi:hypothetical protein